MSFLRHAGIYRSDVVHKTITTWGGAPPPAGRPPAPVQGRDGRNYAPCSSSAMSSRAGYSLAGCSPAEPASASPTGSSMGWGITASNELSANGNLSLISVSQPRGSLHPAAMESQEVAQQAIGGLGDSDKTALVAAWQSETRHGYNLTDNEQILEQYGVILVDLIVSRARQAGARTSER